MSSEVSGGMVLYPLPHAANVPVAWDAGLLSRWQCHGRASGGEKTEMELITPLVLTALESLCQLLQGRCWDEVRPLEKQPRPELHVLTYLASFCGGC